MKVIPESANAIRLVTEDGLTLQIREGVFKDTITISSFQSDHTLHVHKGLIDDKEEPQIYEGFEVKISKGMKSEDWTKIKDKVIHHGRI